MRLAVPALLVPGLLIVGTSLGCAFVGGGVDGTVRDVTTGAPIPDVTVTVEGIPATATTDGDGAYHLRGLAAGPQKLSARRDGYLPTGDLRLTVAQFGMTAAADLTLLPLPTTMGAHAATPSGLVALPQVLETSFVAMPAGHVFALPDAASPPVPTLTSPVDILFDDGGGAPALVELQVARMAHRIPTTFFGEAIPPRWVVLRESQRLSATSIDTRITRLQGKLAEGRYLVRRRHPDGVADWYYPFDVKGGDTLATQADDTAGLQGVRDTVEAEVNGIFTAVLAYDAAFDFYPAAGPTPRALDELDATAVPWPAGSGFDTLGWRPSGPTTPASYTVEVGWNDFTVTGFVDADGDGVPAVISTQGGAPARLLTPADVY